PIPAIERTRLWLYHKPAGLVTSNNDPEGRPTVFERLPVDLPRVISVGRLDLNTEGLLLLTNDGGLARVLELPQTGWLRRYRVRAHGRITQHKLDTLKDGIAVDGVFYGAIEAALEREQGSNVWIEMGLREGKNREVRNVLGALGLQVNRLIRVSYGPFQLGDLPESSVLEVKGKTLRDQLGKKLVDESGANFDAPVLNAFPNRPVKAERPRNDDDRPQRPASEWVPSSANKRDKRASALDRLSTQNPEPVKRRSSDGSRASNVWMAAGARPTSGKPKRGEKPKPADKPSRPKAPRGPKKT
ncbi:MAG: pseudouridine synthase, partial [Pseudomonadota bacterium]